MLTITLFKSRRYHIVEIIFFYISDCDSWFYGDNCDTNCACVQLNSVSCNRINGSCTCNSGYEGADCSTDIDECTDARYNITCIHSTCKNIAGSYTCECDSGKTKVSPTECAGKDITLLQH